MSPQEIAAIVDAWYERYSRAGRMGERNEDMFLALRNRLVPLAPGEPVQFRYRSQRRWLNGTYEGPVGNPDDPYRKGDVWVIRARHSPAATGREQVFLSSVRRRP
jgi:hypothetical protein